MGSPGEITGAFRLPAKLPKSSYGLHPELAHQCLNVSMTQYWAHRGASAHAPENTLPAFEKAIAMGADGVEFDVQRTADGQLVVIHDETIDRTSTGMGPVVDIKYERLQHHDFSNRMVGFDGVKLPLLGEVLEVLKPTDLRINIELKTSIELYLGIEDEALALVEDMGMGEQVIWSSFNHNTMASLRGRVPKESIALLMADALYEPWAYASAFGAGALHPGLHLLRQPGFVDASHEAGLKVHVWTVDDPDLADLAEQMGVDAIITNDPALRDR